MSVIGKPIPRTPYRVPLVTHPAHTRLPIRAQDVLSGSTIRGAAPEPGDAGLPLAARQRKSLPCRASSRAFSHTTDAGSAAQPVPGSTSQSRPRRSDT